MDPSLDNWKLHQPGRYSLVGPSHSGKSELVLKIIGSPDVWLERPDNILYCAPTLVDRQDYLKRMSEVCKQTEAKFNALERVPDAVAELGNQKGIVILDDVMLFPKQELKKIIKLMIMDSHHKNISVLLCMQNPFPKGDEFVTINRNLSGRFILYQLNDMRALVNLSNTLFPGKKNFLPDCLDFAKDHLKTNYVFVNTFPFSGLPRKNTCYTCLFDGERRSNKPIFFDSSKS